MNQRQTTLHALLAVLMVTTLLPVSFAASDPATDSQEAAIKAALPAGNLGPTGNLATLGNNWQVRNEIQNLYFGGANEIKYSVGNGGWTNHLLYDPTVIATDAAQQTTTDQDSVFVLGKAAADVEINAMSAVLALASNQQWQVEVRLEIDGVQAKTISGTDALVTVIQPFTGVDALDPVIPGFGSPLDATLFCAPTYTAGAVFDSAVKIPFNATVGFRVRAVPAITNLADTLDFQYNDSCAPSRAILIGDFARVNAWTETSGGVTRNIFPNPATGSTAERTVQLRLAHVNAFGDVGLFTSSNAHRHTVRVIGPDAKVYYDNHGASVGNPNLPGTVNADASKRWGAAQDDLARTGNLVTGKNGLNFVTYRLSYPSTVPEGAYTVEISAVNDGWTVNLPIFVGSASATLAVSEFDQATTKTILIGEETSFRFRVTNLGSTTDTFALTPEIGATPAGWAASITPSQVTLTPGQSIEAFVQVTPSALGTNGQSNTVRVTATSLTSGVSTVCPAQCLTYTVRLTATPNLLAPNLVVQTAAVELGPGSSRIVPFAVENLGNAADRFILGTQGVPVGWTVSVTPSTVDLEARSQSSPILRIDAPPTAVRGESFNFTLRASRAEDLTAFDTQVFNVKVFLEDRFLFFAVNGDGSLRSTSSVDAPVRQFLRDEGPDAAAVTTFQGIPAPAPVGSGGFWDGLEDPDTDWDQSTLFRLVLVNDGDRADNVRLLPKLLLDSDDRAGALASGAQKTALGMQDIDGCDEASNSNDGGAGDGRNDGWGFRLLDPAASTNPALPVAGGKQTYTNVADMARTVTVPAHSVKYVYAEMGWFIPNTPISEACDDAANRVQGTGAGSRVGDPAPGHAVAIEAISGNDASQRNTHVLNARLVGAGAPGTAPSRLGSQRYSDQTSAVHLGLDLVAGDNDTASKTVGLTAGSTTYRLRATNAGNEVDTLRFSVPQLQDGWEYGFANPDRSLMFANTGNRAGITTCTNPAVTAGQVAFECTMGAGDEVSFTLTAKAPNDDTRLGTSNTVRVTATSKDSLAGSTAKLDSLALTTTLTGSYIFNLLPDVTAVTIQAHPGQAAVVPFTVRNAGTSQDNYTIDLPNAPAASTGWRGDLSHGSLFVPAGRDANGFLVVTPPSNAAAGAQERFRVRATSLDGPAVPHPADLFDVIVNVVAEPTNFDVVGVPKDVVAAPGDAVRLMVKATRTDTATGNATFRLESSSLPAGWVAVDGTGPVTVAYKQGAAYTNFTVRSPDNALGTSRAAVRVTATDGTLSTYTNIGISLSAPSVGIDLSAPGGDVVLVAPGAATNLLLRLENLGVGVENVAMATPNLPAGWTASFESTSVAVQPLQNRTVRMTVTAPASLEPGQSRLLRVTATPSDATRVDSLDLNFTTGNSVPTFAAKLNGTALLLPEEAFRFVVTVSNNGTLADDLLLADALTGTFADVVKVTFDPAQVFLEPGQAKDVFVEVTLPAGLAPRTNVPIVLEARSKGPFLEAVGRLTVPASVIDHKVRDVDGDLANEYAVDRNRDSADGFEQFRDVAASGTVSTAVDPLQLMSEEARARHTVFVAGSDGNTTSVVSFLFDGDEDNRTDLLIDQDGDGVQDIYWDADRGYSHALPTSKDVTKDGRADDFIDLDGVNGLVFDVYYDAYNGVFGKLLQVDLDNNGQPDYVVDANGNGQADSDETVLFGGPEGTFVKSQERRDVDGDGQLDTVVDADGDGQPDYFVPAGSEAGVPIVLEDVNGDGILDWTYDADGDGRRDSFFDPATGRSGLTDPGTGFVEQLKEYWYVGALFGVVLVLFVVLLMVTRK